MKKLIITAHPSSRGFAHKLAKEYERSAQESGFETEIIDLYNCPWCQDFLRFEYVRQLPSDVNREILQEKIIEADELSFFFPLWWWDAPAILKNFFDCNFISGFAYSYSSNLPVGLLKPRTARIFITCDGPSIFYRLLGNPFKTIWIKGRLNFCGVKVKTYLLFDRMRSRTQEEKKSWLQKVYSLGKEK